MNAPKIIHQILGAIVVLAIFALWLFHDSPSVLTPVVISSHQVSKPVAGQTPAKTTRPDNETPGTLPTTSATPRKFSQMGVLERTAILNQIEQEDFTDIMQAWLDADRVEHDPRKHQNLQGTLILAMQERAVSPEFLDQIHDFILNKSNANLDRGMLLAVLAHVQSHETVAMLLEFARTLDESELRESAIAELAILGGVGDYEYLAPDLEQAWHTADASDVLLLRNISYAMARIGAASSIELLLHAALGNTGMDGSRKIAALNALADATILNAHAVPPLAALLSDDFPSNEASALASRTLFAMQGVPANQALVNWIQRAVSTSLAHDYSGHTQNPMVWQPALDPTVPFRSEQNREAIRAGLAEHKAGIIFEPVPKSGSGQ